jgi:TubC N-terminal docking domain
MSPVQALRRLHPLLEELALRGISVAVEGTRLRLRPRSALDPALVARLLACKAELLAALRPAPPARRPLAGRPLAPHPHRLQLPGQPPGALTLTETWVLLALAEAPGLSRARLHASLEWAIDALLDRGEIQTLGTGDSCASAALEIKLR